MRTLARHGSLPTASAVLVLIVSACGAGHNGSAGTSTPPSPTPKQANQVQATLVGENHAPTVNRLWRYAVKVSDRSGRPLSGTVDIEFVFNGTVVGHDTPLTHPITGGRWQDTLKFPPAAVGQPLALRAVVHTSAGSVTLDWPIQVKR